MESKIEKYFSKHIVFTATIHAIGGIGLGALLTHVWFDPHPVRYGLLFLGIALAGHIYAYRLGKKGNSKH